MRSLTYFFIVLEELTVGVKKKISEGLDNHLVNLISFELVRSFLEDDFGGDVNNFIKAHVEAEDIVKGSDEGCIKDGRVSKALGVTINPDVKKEGNGQDFGEL